MDWNASSRLASWYSLDFVKYTDYILTMSCATNNVDLRQDHGRGSTPPPFHHHCLPSDKALASWVSLRCQPFRSCKAWVLVCWPGKTLTGIQIPRWKVCVGLRESCGHNLEEHGRRAGADHERVETWKHEVAPPDGCGESSNVLEVTLHCKVHLEMTLGSEQNSLWVGPCPFMDH